MNTHDTSDQLPKTNFTILLHITKPAWIQNILDIIKKDDLWFDWDQPIQISEESYNERRIYYENKFEIMDFSDYIAQWWVSKIFEKRLLDFIDERWNIPELVWKFEINFEIVSFVETAENNREKLLKMLKIYHNTCSEIIEKTFHFMGYWYRNMKQISIIENDTNYYSGFEEKETRQFNNKVKSLNAIMK